MLELLGGRVYIGLLLRKSCSIWCGRAKRGVIAHVIPHHVQNWRADHVAPIIHVTFGEALNPP